MKQEIFYSFRFWPHSYCEALKSVGLRPSRKIQLYNGPLECRFVRYDLYEGTKKVKKVEE